MGSGILRMYGRREFRNDLTHFHVLFRLRRGADYGVRLQMLCRSIICLLSTMWTYFFPLLLFVNHLHWAMRPVVAAALVFLHLSWGVMKLCESQVWMCEWLPNLVRYWWNNWSLGCWVHLHPASAADTHHGHLSANLSVIWVRFCYSPNFAQVEATCASAKELNWNRVWCCGDFWIFLPISQTLVLSCKMFI